MSVESYFSVKRSGVAVPSLSRIYGYREDISLQVIAAASGAVPNNSYTFISINPPIFDLQQGDLLIDAGETDTKTASGQAEYRVNGNPEVFYGDHIESMIVRVVGKTP